MIAQTPSRLFIDSKPLLDTGDFDALRARASEEGYLFFRGLLPREPLFELRAKILEVVQAFGWLREGEHGEDNLANREAINTIPLESMRYGIGISDAAYEEVQKIEQLHRLPHHPALLDLYRGLFGENVLVHARHIARVVTPHDGTPPTPQHQDFPLIQGTDKFWTCWFPLGDCPREMGSLTVLRRSQHNGYIPIQRVRGAGEIAAQLCPGEDRWIEGDFEAGDVLTFPCYTVHKALKSRHPERIRLSMDLRYQPMSEEVERRSLEPHAYKLSWEQIYEGWESDTYQYYWKDLPLKMGPWDDSLVQPSRRIC